VSKVSIRRALHILQVLLVALERRRYSASIKEGKTFITVLGEPFRVFLKERLLQKPRELTPDEHRQRREGIAVNPYVLVPSGELAFHIGDSYTQRSTADGKRRRLEDSLNLFVENLIQRAYSEKSRRAEREREEERRKEAESRRREREQRQREHDAATARLDVLAAAWAKTEQRRAFLVQLREACGPVEEGTELAGWLNVVERWTDIADPLTVFRAPRKTLKLYYAAAGYDLAEVRRAGFHDPEPPARYGNEKAPPPGVQLVDRPTSTWHSESMELELPEDAVLPYEVTAPGYIPRTFFMPARVLNGILGKGPRESAEAEDSDDLDEEDDDNWQE
jgi:hypothetical protein